MTLKQKEPRTFPWKRDAKLEAEARELEGLDKLLENEVVFDFGFRLGRYAKDLEHIDIVFRSKFPDALLVNKDTNEVMNVEFEIKSSNFLEHEHDPKVCDLIVCFVHDWKDCPIDVYELVTDELHKARKK